MTTIPSGSIANYYCPLNHNSPIATPECKELGNSYCLDKPPFLVIPCLPAAVRNTHYFCPLLSIIFVAKTKITIWAESTNGFSPLFFSFQKFYRTVIFGKPNYKSVNKLDGSTEPTLFDCLTF